MVVMRHEHLLVLCLVAVRLVLNLAEVALLNLVAVVLTLLVLFLLLLPLECLHFAH